MYAFTPTQEKKTRRFVTYISGTKCLHLTFCTRYIKILYHNVSNKFIGNQELIRRVFSCAISYQWQWWIHYKIRIWMKKIRLLSEAMRSETKMHSCRQLNCEHLSSVKYKLNIRSPYQFM